MSLKGRNLLLAELERRPQALTSKVVDLLDTTFPEQRNFIEDNSRLKGALCTRRSGKSDADSRMLVRCCLDFPKSRTVFIGLTRESARGIIWDMLKELCQRYGLKARFNETRLVVQFANKSTIHLLGMDSNETEQKKALGTKLRMVVIDEAQGFAIDLEKLIMGTLLPATADLQGQVVLTGTPGDLLSGYFYKLTRTLGDPNTPGQATVDGWSLHRWGAPQNPHMAQQWAADIAMLKRQRPGIEATPSFLQNYMGLWVVAEDVLVYRYVPGRNDASQLPKFMNWHYVLGCDLGLRDASAFSLVAYTDFEKVLYVVETKQATGMDFTDVADVIKDYQKRFDLDSIIIDGANAQGVEEMRRRHSLPLVRAEKTAKVDYIRLMNSDFIRGAIKLLPKAEDLKVEYPSLIWDARKLPMKYVEHEACSNHCADATLYAWRHCYPYLSEPVVERPTLVYGSPTWAQEESKRIEQRLMAEAKQQAESGPREELGWSTSHPDKW